MFLSVGFFFFSLFQVEDGDDMLADFKASGETVQNRVKFSVVIRFTVNIFTTERRWIKLKVLRAHVCNVCASNT